MADDKCIFSPVRRKRLEAQGVRGYSDRQLKDFAFGLRFAYVVCLSIVIAGLLLTSMPVLSAAFILAFLGMFPPRHPVDYFYNYILRHALGKPKIPPRANQGRFACVMATLMLACIIYFTAIGNLIIANSIGAVLVATAILVSTTDFCIPSLIYNLIFSYKKK